MNTIYQERVGLSVAFLDNWFEDPEKPEIAVVLGSGLSQAIPHIDSMLGISYQDIPGFKQTHVLGHAGDLKIGNVSLEHQGQIKQKKVAFLRGRIHAYEGHNAAEVVHNIRTLIRWGVKDVILTNASGCLNTQWELGRMMVITDHINGTGLSPLNGDFGVGFGERFVDLSNCYDDSWQKRFSTAAQACGQTIYNGIYYGTLGSQYETPAEIRMMQINGAHAVGMSTVLEALAIRQMGARVAGLSCLTNYGAGLSSSILSHGDVMNMGKRFAQDMVDVLLRAIIFT